MVSTKELQNLISPKFNDETIVKIVEKYSGLKEISIQEINAAAATSKGDSYLSTVSRLTIEVEGCTESGTKTTVKVPVIVKSLPENVGRRKTFRSTDFFENEVIFYEKVWSALQKFQATKDIKKPFQDIPMLLSAWLDGENDFIALEDLTYKGYGGVARSGSVDYEHASLIMRLFARFHGLAFAFKQQDPERFESIALELKETYFGEKHRKWYEVFQKKLVEIARDAVKKELPQKYLDKFEEFCDKDLYGLFCKISEERGLLSVITQGDAWLPNFLLKYDTNEKPLEAMMIDFQLARYTTCVTDIVFFLYVCVDEAMREKHWDDLILEYHNAFTDIVKQLGTDPGLVSLETLKDELKKYGCFGLGMGMEAITMSLLDESQVSDLDTIEGDEAVPIESVWIVKPLDSPEKRQRLAEIFKHATDNHFI